MPNSAISRSCIFLLLSVFVLSEASGSKLYVDNQSGMDEFDGSSRVVYDGGAGPVRTIRRSLELARTGDTIVIANHGVPYYESIQLVGVRHSGHEHASPFRILGNGAVLSGAMPVPATAWRNVKPSLWKFTPWRKGHYLLLDGTTPLPEQSIPEGSIELPEIPAGHWCAWKGSVYYRTQPDARPQEQELRFAAGGVGVSLYNVRGVEIADLTLRHFRLDGVNAHDLCQDVVLVNVTALENGRAGVCVAGSSQVQVRESKLTGNREHSLLITERAGAELEGTEVSSPPTVQE